MITGLIPFCLHHYSDETKKWFSSLALDGSSGSKWDAKSGTVITPNDKVVQDKLSSKFWWLKDSLQGIKEDHISTEPTQPIKLNTNVAGHPLSTGSQVTLKKKWRKLTTTPDATTHENIFISLTSQDSSADADSSDDSNSNKVQTTGNSMREEEDDSRTGSNSDTEAIKKLLLQNPKVFQQLLAKEAKKNSKVKQKKHAATKITPPKPKKAGAPARGSSKTS
jgi:hypothetical protein